MKTQLTVKTQMSVLAQTGANQVLKRIPTSEVETARRAVCGRLGEATLPKADLRLAQTWNGCHSTRPTMRVWKQILPALLGCILLSMSMAATAQDYDGFEFTTNADGNSVTITNYTGSSDVVNIPNTIDGLSVTEIGADAFSGCTNLTSVTIPNSVTNIGNYAFFDCTSLTNVVLDDNLISIGNYAFSGEIQGGGERTVESEACGLTSVTIPNSVTSIGDYAFYNCSALTNVTIGSGVTSIGNYSFSGDAIGSLWSVWYEAGGLGSVTLPNSVTNIGSGAFEGCRLTNVTISLGVTDIGSNAFSWSFLTSVTIPDSVTSIGDYAFCDCSALTNVTIGNSVTSIGNYAFSGEPFGTEQYSRSPLTSIIIPNSVTNIGAGAFCYCWSLKEVFFQGNAPSADSTVFSGSPATAYYLPGTTGWDEFSANTGLPTALWTLPYPLILNSTPSFGVQSNGFSFNISWATNHSVVVEACTDLANPVWQPLQTNTLTATPAGGAFQFSDLQWTNYPARFYRVRSQ